MMKSLFLATAIIVTSIASSQAHCGTCDHKDEKKGKSEQKDDKDDKKPEEKK